MRPSVLPEGFGGRFWLHACVFAETILADTLSLSTLLRKGLLRDSCFCLFFCGKPKKQNKRYFKEEEKEENYAGLDFF